MSFFRFILLAVTVSSFAVDIAANPVSPSKNTGPIVDLGYSQYEGISLSSGVNQYLGMRFAAPPLGGLRFRAPVNPDITTGVQGATAFKPVCLGIRTVLPSTSEAEDCLFVNVWGPASANPHSKLPVWVYIQGGGYTTNSNRNYNGSTVVETSGQNIVFVNFNYRVGPYGFLASEKIRQNGNLNAGLLDQELLLRWVQKNIARFGGDPKHVVIHGASAGAGSVALHLTAHGGRNDKLFVGAIGQSVFFPAQPKVFELEWQFERYVNETNCSESADALACLRSQDTAVLQAANVPSPFPGQAGSPLFYWTPTIDGDFIQDYPYILFEEGKIIKVPIIFGGDTDEGTNFAANAASPADVATFFKNNYPLLNSVNTDAINSQYPLMPSLPNHAAYFPSAAAAYGESTFTCAGNFISNTYAKLVSPSKVWNYRYNVQMDAYIAAGVGVPHTIESAAIFGVGNVNDDANAQVRTGYTTYNAEIIPVVMNYYISFIRALDPNRYKYKDAPRWGNFGHGTDAGRRLMMQTNATAMEVIPQDQVAKCEFWRKLAPIMEQ